MPKTLKPKPLSKRLERQLRELSSAHRGELRHLAVGDIRAILAALEYERQRADVAEAALRKDETPEGRGRPEAGD